MNARVKAEDEASSLRSLVAEADAKVEQIEEEEDDDEDDDEMEDDEELDDAEGQDEEEYPFPVEQLEEWEKRHARRRGGESSYRFQRENRFYPLYVDVKAGKVVGRGPSIPLDQEPDFRPVKVT